MIASGVTVSRDVISGLVYLIGTFAITAGIYVLIGSKFLGVIFLIVYVGAVAILFLFVIMFVRFKEIVASFPGEEELTITPLTAVGGLIFSGLL